MPCIAEPSPWHRNLMRVANAPEIEEQAVPEVRGANGGHLVRHIKLFLGTSSHLRWPILVGIVATLTWNLALPILY